MSKELEALNNIKRTCEYIDFKTGNGLGIYANQAYFEIIEQSLERKEKLEKAFEIIKEKKVNIHLLMRSAWVKEYNSCGYRSLTKAEFKLLKEMFGQ